MLLPMMLMPLSVGAIIGSYQQAMLWGGQHLPHLMTTAHCSRCSSQLSLPLSLCRSSLGIAGMQPICQNGSL